MRRVVMVNPRDPGSLDYRLGATVRAYVFGSVARGDANANSDLDIYVAGPGAEAVEDQYFLEHPVTVFEDGTYPLHVIGPSMVSEQDFLRCQPEARRVR